MDDIRGRAAFALTEALILLLIEGGVVTSEQALTSIETLVKHQRALATAVDVSAREQAICSGIADVIEDITRGTNLQSAEQARFPKKASS